MRIWRVVRHAPGRPDSPSPAPLRHASRNPPPRTPLKFPARTDHVTAELPRACTEHHVKLLDCWNVSHHDDAAFVSCF
eukprot:1151724-Pelagomonas_calceolata.AAC.7